MSPHARSRSWTSGPLFFAAVFVGLVLLTLAWAFATPIAATPDEPQHLIKAAAVARGELIGRVHPGEPQTTVVVPDTVAHAEQRAWTCFAFHPDVSAQCQHVGTGSLTLSSARTSAGLYNPVYYALIGWPSLVAPTSASAIFSMRLVSSLLCAGLAALGITLVRAVVHPAVLVLAVLGGLTPMVFFLFAAVNPNGFEVASGLAFLCALLRISRSPGRGEISKAAAITAGVSGALLVNARGISIAWGAEIVAIVVILTPWSRLRELARSWWVRAVGIAVLLGVAAAAAWILKTGGLGSFVPGPGSGGAVTPRQAFALMLFSRPFDLQVIGVFGWGDTVTTNFVYTVYAAIILGSVLLGFVVGRGRALMAVALSAAVVLLVAPVLTAATIVRNGYIWQGRYELVAVAGLLVVVAVAVSDSGALRTVSRRAVRIPVVVGLAAGLAQFDAFCQALRRYTVGSNGSPFAFVDGVQWAPPGGGAPWVALALSGLVILEILLVLVVVLHGRTEGRPLVTRADGNTT